MTMPEMKIAIVVVIRLLVCRESGSVEPGVVAVQQGAADTPILRIGARRAKRQAVARVGRVARIERRGKLTRAVVRLPGHSLRPPPWAGRRQEHPSRIDGCRGAGGTVRADNDVVTDRRFRCGVRHRDPLSGCGLAY
nr:hypothetical protein GCM10020092_049250 [Actinoplanes digitatis]